MSAPLGRHLGIDLGDVRTGLAICDEDGTLAMPLDVLRERSREKLARMIVERYHQRAAVAVVIGLPLNMDGSEGPRARIVRAFGELLHGLGITTVIFHDERLSSFEAESLLAESGLDPRKRKQRADAVAAQLVLQSWLDQRKGGRS